MATYILFGVEAPTLDAARDLVEKILRVQLDAREGHHSGGNYYSFGPDLILTLKDNIDLDDDEMEFGGLSEPDFPSHPHLLYVNDADVVPQLVAALDAAPHVFERLRTESA